MQVITKATLDQFQNAVGLNRRLTGSEDALRRASQINISLSPTYEIVGAVALAYRKFVASTRDEPSKESFFGKTCKIRLCHSTSAVLKTQPCGGYVVIKDELLAFHNTERGAGAWLLDHAVSDGARKLSCLDVAHLINLYNSRGFKEVRREFNEVKGRPDVVWLEKQDESKVSDD